VNSGKAGGTRSRRPFFMSRRRRRPRYCRRFTSAMDIRHMRRTTRLRQLIEAPEILVMPGVHDALGAKIAEQAGFAALTMGGYSSTATLLGQPDTSQLSLTELADHYARLCDAVSVPVFGDGDTGTDTAS